MNEERFRQIEELYHAARERKPEEREALLAQADAEVRAKVEALLAHDDSGDKILDRPAWEAEPSLLGQPGNASLTPGAQIGPYKIEAELGTGGMGDVYRAVDTRLNRPVAIKVAKERFSERSQREARAIAALNHSNICTLYDVGPNYLVMELIEDKPLTGPLPLDQALRYAAQICDALDAAHRKAITHRDLKPGNILVTKQGIKLLDFGLARMAPGESDPTLTRPGDVMGTPAYMAPEQREGKPGDARSDIYAFGCVLYEMLTGKRAVEERTPVEPAALEGVLGTCLEKDPEDRWQSARELKHALGWVAGQGMTSPATRSPAPLGWTAVAGVLVLALMVVGTLFLRATRPPPLRPLVRLNAEIAADTPLARVDGSVLALSPDGARLALTLRGADGKVRLHTRLLQQNQFTALAGTENAFSPFFSPDGEWIGFFADDKLKKISVEGGAAVTLCDAPDPDGASWGDDGNIVAAPNGEAGGLWRVHSSGGSCVPLTKLNPGEVTHRWPQVLPGSQAVLFTVHTQFGNYDEANIDAFSLKTGERKTVQRGGFSARYMATSGGGGQLVYLHESTLFAVPFDPGRMALAGVPTPILEDVRERGGAGGDFAFGGAPSGPGTFVYLSGKRQGLQPISWLDSAGKIQPLHAPPGVYTTPRFSPDGKRLAFALASGTGVDIWVKDLDRDTPSRLSFLAGVNRWPVWTPDGKNIVLRSENSPAPGLYWIRSDGSGEAQRLTDGKLNERPASFSPDGKRLAFSGNGNSGSQDIFTASIESDPGHVRLGKPELFVGTPFYEGNPAFSPDGRWLAYDSSESGGTLEVYVRPFPGPGGRWQISTHEGFFPVWSRDGRELLFQQGPQVMAVSYNTKGDSFAAGKPRVWSGARLNEGGMPGYDLAPDGKRLAAILASDQAGGEPTHLTFLLNFFDELRRRVPAGK
jgi:Tol biopolymer transport system component